MKKKSLGKACGSARQLGSNLQDAFQNTSTGNTALQIIHFAAGFVYVERADDDQPRLGGEIPKGDRDLVHHVLRNHLDVVLELG